MSQTACFKDCYFVNLAKLDVKESTREEMALDIFPAFHCVSIPTSKFVQSSSNPSYYCVHDQEDRNAFCGPESRAVL